MPIPAATTIPAAKKLKNNRALGLIPRMSSINPITKVNPIAIRIPVKCLSNFKKTKAVTSTAKNIGIPPPLGTGLL